MNWIEKIKDNKKKVYCQNGQDGIAKYIFQNVGTTNKFCVEFGFNDRGLTGGTGSNVARLIIEEGWISLLLDNINENPQINLHKEFLTPQNICEIFKKYDVPKEFDYLSVDVDSVDILLLEGILMGGYIPRVICSEYNANFDIDMSVTCKEGVSWDGMSSIYGASLLAFYILCHNFNYVLVAACEHTTQDLFMIRKDLISESTIPPLKYFEKSVLLKHHVFPNKNDMLKSFVLYPSGNPVPEEYYNRLCGKL